MRLLTFGFAVVFVTCFSRTCDAQSFQLSPYWVQPSQVVLPNDVGYSAPYHWGNTSIPTIAAVVPSGFRAIRPTVVGFSGGTRDLKSADTESRTSGSTSSSRELRRSETRDQLATAQEKARDLLLKTAGLQETKFPASANNASSKEAVDVKTNEGVIVEPARDFGTDPWKDVEVYQATGAVVAETLPAPKPGK